MRYRVFSFSEPPKVPAEDAGTPRQPFRSRPGAAIAARYRVHTVRLPEFMKIGSASRFARRHRLY
jgi:hypothetical protein